MTESRATGPPYRVVIADDDPMIRTSLGALLDDHPALVVVGSADSGSGIAELSRELQPQIALLDVMMPMGGLEAMAAVLAESPQTVVAFYTAQADRRTCARLLAAGALAVFAKGAAIDLAAEVHELAAKARTGS